MEPEKIEKLTEMRPPVLLCWTDELSGEELCILVHGPAEFLEELEKDGFRPGSAAFTFDRRAPCVVVASR